MTNVTLMPSRQSSLPSAIGNPRPSLGHEMLTQALRTSASEEQPAATLRCGPSKGFRSLRFGQLPGPPHPRFAVRRQWRASDRFVPPAPRPPIELRAAACRSSRPSARDESTQYNFATHGAPVERRMAVRLADRWCEARSRLWQIWARQFAADCRTRFRAGFLPMIRCLRR